MHDWSRLNFNSHGSKTDRLQMTHATDVGYELQSSLLLSADSGIPIAQVVQNLVTAQGSWQSRAEEQQTTAPHLDELSERIAWLAQQPCSKQLVHIVDREADSVRHLRAWHEHHWLIRAKAGSKADYDGSAHNLKDIAAMLRYQTVPIEPVNGKHVVLQVAEAAVVLSRPAWPGGRQNKHQSLPGEPLPVRLIVSRRQDEDGKELAFWTLLSNVPAAVSAEELARWYSWRWRIESFFKVLKSAGHQVESWLQHSGSALAKRLLVASQGCVLVWRLMRRQGEEAAQARAFLQRLSGRQLKRGHQATAPALLAGLFALLQALELLEQYRPEQLREMARLVLGRDV